MSRRAPASRVRERANEAPSLLLDTHVWVWMLAGDRSRMPATVWSLLEAAAAGGSLGVSDLSCWEMALKVARGKYTLSLPLDEWLDQATLAPGITMLPLDRATLVLGAKLTEMHGDPADRWLVATAKLRRLTLLTADTTILDFAARERMTAVRDVRHGR